MAPTQLLRHGAKTPCLDSWIFAGGDGVVGDVFAGGQRVVSQGRHLRREAIFSRFTATMRRLLVGI